MQTDNCTVKPTCHPVLEHHLHMFISVAALYVICLVPIKSTKLHDTVTLSTTQTTVLAKLTFTAVLWEYLYPPMNKTSRPQQLKMHGKCS
jgi:hypothetical protein